MVLQPTCRARAAGAGERGGGSGEPATERSKPAQVSRCGKAPASTSAAPCSPARTSATPRCLHPRAAAALRRTACSRQCPRRQGSSSSGTAGASRFWSTGGASGRNRWSARRRRTCRRGGWRLHAPPWAAVRTSVQAQARGRARDSWRRCRCRTRRRRRRQRRMQQRQQTARSRRRRCAGWRLLEWRRLRSSRATSCRCGGGKRMGCVLLQALALALPPRPLCRPSCIRRKLCAAPSWADLACRLPPPTSLAAPPDR